jgi:uncharacterized membrane protein
VREWGFLVCGGLRIAFLFAFVCLWGCESEWGFRVFVCGDVEALCGLSVRLMALCVGVFFCFLFACEWGFEPLFWRGVRGCFLLLLFRLVGWLVVCVCMQLRFLPIACVCGSVMREKRAFVGLLVIATLGVFA